MDSFELNKILGAILGTLLFVMGVGFLAEAIYQPAHSIGPGYDLPEPTTTDTGTGDTTGGPAAAPVDIGTLLAKADPKAGEAASKKCQSCHDFTKGGPNKTGPNLYGIVGEKIADVPGFAFSDALKAHASETWDYEKLNQWLISPKAFAPGTKMTYAGDKDDSDRANIIAYLSTLTDSTPVPFPAPAAPAAPAAPSSAAPAAPDASSSAAPAPAASSSAAPAPAPSSSEAPATSSSAAPAPAPSSSEAPAPSSSAAPAPAPSSSAAPVASSSAAQ